MHPSKCNLTLCARARGRQRARGGTARRLRPFSRVWGMKTCSSYPRARCDATAQLCLRLRHAPLDRRADAAGRMQRASIDLVNVGETVEAEKDALLERFFAFARHVCAALRDQGHWADYIDPCSGLPVRLLLLVPSASAHRALRVAPGPLCARWRSFRVPCAASAPLLA